MTSVPEPATHINPAVVHLCITGVMQFYWRGNFLNSEKLGDHKVQIWVGLANDSV